MAGKHQPHWRSRIHGDDDVAVEIGPHLVGELAGVLPDDALHRLFVTGGARRFENLLKKLFR